MRLVVCFSLTAIFVAAALFADGRLVMPVDVGVAGELPAAR